MSDKKELLATSAAKMRAAREVGAVLLFPSGNSYRVRVPTPAEMLRRGNLPNPLLSFVVDAFYNDLTQEKYDKFLGASDKAEDALALADSLKAICQAMFLDPRVADNPTADDEVLIFDVPLSDQLWAFRLFCAPMEVLYPFRAEPQTDVVSVAGAQDVPQATERRPRSRGQGKRAQS